MSLAPRLRAALLLAFALGLAAYAWDKGPDPWIDFGRELYVPWRLTQGDALHRDVAWFNGPLSPWWNALWMRLCGVSFDTLQVVNLGVALLCGALLRRLVRAATDGFAADVALFAFFPLFAFAQPSAIGNYTYLAPYSHCLVHGFALGLGALAAFHEARRRGRGVWAFVGGVALGLAFLTKAEAFLAAAGASAVALGSALLTGRPEARRRARLRTSVAAAAGFVLPLAAAWAVLASQLPRADAARAMLGTWAYALDPALSDLHFYRTMRGTDAPREHVTRALRVAGGVGLALLAAIALARVAARFGGRWPAKWRPVESLALGGLAFGAVGVVFLRLPIEPLLRPLPFAVIALLTLAARDLFSDEPVRRERGAAGLVLAVYGGLMTLKLGLRPSVREYGFVLAAPATTFAIAALVHRFPRVAGSAAPQLRALVVGGVAALGALHLHTTTSWFSRRTVEVGSGGDRIWSQPWRTSELGALLAELDTRVPADGTLLVLPEGVSLNYWLRRRAPIPVYNFMPPELVMYGEARLVEALEASPPDVVVLAHKETPEYGYRFFGQGYGEQLTRWLREQYVEVSRYGAAPMTSSEWGASVFVPR